MSRTKAVLIATTMLLVSVGPGTARGADQNADGTPGTSGIGDYYYPLDGNGGYDVTHYDLDVRYDPATDVLTGVARIDAAATQDLSSFNLDFDGMTVRSIAVGSGDGDDADPATWSRDRGELTVTPENSLPDGEEFTTVVRYDGVPQTQADLGGSGFMHTDDGAIVAGEPRGAATWFPANDHPRDPASVSVSATVPAGLQAVSNGVLTDQETKEGWTTWSWNAHEPMATYLVTLAIGHFDVHHYAADGVQYWDALDPDLFTQDLDPQTGGPSVGDVARGALARQPEIIGFLSGIFGPYPFRSAGGIIDDSPDLRFALETQTRPVYSPSFFFDPVGGADVLAHELAHQWTGDWLRVDEWRHIWLNEGFATYAEWLWLEHEGLTTPQQMFDDIAANAPPEFWQTTIGDPGAPTEKLFDDAVYARGAMTLQALRQTVGDEVFFRILRKWVSSQGGGTVTTNEFTQLAEGESGMQLDDFFQAWLFTAKKPAGLGAAPAHATATVSGGQSAGAEALHPHLGRWYAHAHE
jgi:aminopeptidase N